MPDFPGIVEDVMQRFGELTGRRYGLFEYFGAADAEHAVILMGSASARPKRRVETLGRARREGRYDQGAPVPALHPRTC